MRLKIKFNKDDVKSTNYVIKLSFMVVFSSNMGRGGILFVRLKDFSNSLFYGIILGIKDFFVIHGNIGFLFAIFNRIIIHSYIGFYLRY